SASRLSSQRNNSIRVAAAQVGEHHAVLDWVSLLVGVALTALRGHRALVEENLLLRQQLAVALRAGRRPRLCWHDRRFWAVARRLCAAWRRHLELVQPETVLRWPRRGWRLYWWWRSGCTAGRPTTGSYRSHTPSARAPKSTCASRRTSTCSGSMKSRSV